MIEIAREYEGMGLMPIPVDVGLDSCKVIAEWRSNPKSVDGWSDLFDRQSGIGIKLGSASNNLVCVDIDQKHDHTFTLSNRFLEALKVFMPDMWHDWYIEETRSGGLHIFFYLAESVTKHEPARTIDLNKSNLEQEFALIEVLCEGQMVFTSPTKGYKVIQGEIEEIPKISNRVYADLMSLCSSFNEVPQSDVVTSEYEYSDDVDVNDRRPGTLFNRKCEPDHFAQYLVQEGWSVHKKMGQKYWMTRPGKESGVSATWNHDGRKLFCVFSSSVGLPTHHDNGSMRGYTPFAIYTHFSHEGDYAKAATQLVKDGFIDPDEWEDVEPLHPVKSSPFDLDDLLPDTLSEFRSYIKEVADAYQVHPEMVIMPCLSIVSLALSGAVKTRVKPNWVEDAPLWSITIAEASERKSPVLKELMRPVDNYLSKFKKEHRQNISAIGLKKRGLEAQIKKLEKEYENAVVAGQKGLSELSRVASLEEELENLPEVTDVPNLILSDVTPEALVHALKRNGEVCGVISSEADPIEVALGLYSNKPNFSIYLKGYSVETYVATRVLNGEVVIDQPRIVMSVMMQREPMHKLSSNVQAINRGFLARCLFACPQSMVGRRDLNPISITDVSKRFWKETIERLMDMPHRFRLHAEGGEVDIHTDDPVDVKLSKEANEILEKARSRNEEGLADGGEFDMDKAWAGKLMGNIVRLSCVLHFIDGKTPKDEISGVIMEYAVKWVDPLHEHYLEATGHVGSSIIDAKVYSVMKRLIKKSWKGGPVTEAQLKAREGRNNKSEDFKPIWERMEKLGFIRIKKEQTGKSGPKKAIMEVHPEFHNLVEM